MEDSSSWIDQKSKEGVATNFVCTVLKRCKYGVMHYGIETHNQEIIRAIALVDDDETNRRLRSMPDLVVVDPETTHAWLVEVKYRELKYINERTRILAKPHRIEDYVRFWPDTILVYVLPHDPFCVCVRVADIDCEKDFDGPFFDKNGRGAAVWNFWGKFRELQEVFSRVTPEDFAAGLKGARL